MICSKPSSINGFGHLLLTPRKYRRRLKFFIAPNGCSVFAVYGRIRVVSATKKRACGRISPNEKASPAPGAGIQLVVAMTAFTIKVASFNHQADSTFGTGPTSVLA